MITTKWDTATGEVLIRVDAQTAHEMFKLLQRDAPCKELVTLRGSLGHTIQHPTKGEGPSV